MVSDLFKKWHVVPLIWSIAALIFAFLAGVCVNINNILCVMFSICSLGCGFIILRHIKSAGNRMRYLVDATLSGDFSYKFPTVNVNKDEEEINMMLNHIVEHLEHLTLDARQNEVFLAKVINLTNFGLALANSKGDIMFHNDAALRLLERHALTNVCQLPDQSAVDLEIKRNDVSVNDKSFTLYTITDLSRQMQAVEVESWEKLTRVLTHEIMNSLTPIQSIAENMSGKTTEKETTEAFETISSSSSSLMQFVRNFREFSFLPEPRMRALYLKPLLESSIRMARAYASSIGNVVHSSGVNPVEENSPEDIIFKLICFPPELMVYTDESLLSRVLINILKNAIEANPSVISLEADVKPDESVEIQISNNGEHITDETADHIFTPFFTTRPSGNGIGLSLSRRIITHLGGTLTLKTRPETCFSIKI